MESGKGSYSDKRAVVTGGGSGIGFAVARLLVDRGARVAITGRSQATLDRARERLGEIVNAGIAPLTPFESTTGEAFDEVHAINVKGAYSTVQKLAPLLSTGAGVVLTTSIANTTGTPETSV